MSSSGHTDDDALADHGAHRLRRRSAISPALLPDHPRAEREQVVPVLDSGLIPVLVELDLTADVDTEATRQRFRQRYVDSSPGLQDRAAPVDIADSYLKCLLTPEELEALWQADRSGAGGLRPTIFRVWPDYTLHAHIDRSVSTIKSDAAGRTYAATGEGIVWGVVDSGVDRSHPHFRCGTFDERTQAWSKDFTHLVDTQKPAQPPTSDSAPSAPTDSQTAGTADAEAADAEAPFQDLDGHGTHVAGIIAGSLPDDVTPVLGTQQRTAGGLPRWAVRELDMGRTLSGVASKCRLVSLRVLAQRDGALVTSSSAVIEALYYVRTKLNDGGRHLAVHGVNLSLGCAWDPSDYATGQSPLCREVNLLVGSGVVVVVSAGNGGSTSSSAAGASNDFRGVLASITDPGNAEDAITVGSTHRDAPHRYGVTYTSSKGPTLDGRLKPDLLAPGERITSAATGALRSAMAAHLPSAPDGWAAYIEDSGTSMAAPHVSGAIAAFLSVRPEFIGLPAQVKDLFCANATSLGRDHYLEGHGLIDLMRVLSSV